MFALQWGPGPRTKQGLNAGWGPSGPKPQFLGNLHRRVPATEGCGLCPVNSLPLGEGHSPREHRDILFGTKRNAALAERTAPLRPPEPLTVCKPCRGHSRTHTASPLSTPQPRSTPAITAVSSGSKVCKKFNLLCAELRVVLGSGLALALGANTDIHT